MMRKLMNRFRIALTLTILWIIVMSIFSPPNIIDFEFAGTPQNAKLIIDTWGEDGVRQAKTSIYLDFVFLMLYSAAISLGCRVASEYSRQRLLVRAGGVLSMMVWLAGICDAIENLAMLQSLKQVTPTAVSIANDFAAVKFSIVFIGLAFILMAFTAGVIKRTKPTAN